MVNVSASIIHRGKVCHHPKVVNGGCIFGPARVVEGGVERGVGPTERHEPKMPHAWALRTA